MQVNRVTVGGNTQRRVTSQRGQETEGKVK
jgi:hypothetical protein